MRSSSTSTCLEHEAFVLPPSEGYPLTVTAKRYFPPSVSNRDNKDALTLIFLHSTSFHKEAWEATVEDLFQLCDEQAEDAAQDRKELGDEIAIREAWSVECPNHGASAALNAEALLTFGDFGCELYAKAAHRFLTHPHSPFDASTRSVVVIGHSLGGVTATYLHMSAPPLRISSFILIDPILAPDPPGVRRYDKLRQMLLSRTRTRPYIWPSREHAYQAIKKGWKRFDERVLRALVTHGVIPSKTRKGYVELACTPAQEAIMYVDEYGPTRSMDTLARISHLIPVHAIFGERADFVPRDVQDALVDPKSPRRFASVIRMGGVGHLIPQEKPGDLARVIKNCLHQNKTEKKPPFSATRSKL